MLRPVAIGLFLCVLAPSASADLSRGWEYRADTPEGPGPWRPVMLGEVRSAPGVPFHGWFRVRLPQGQYEDPSILFEDLESYFVARIDGREIGAWRAPPGGFVLPGWGWRILRLPHDFAGRELELEVSGSTPVDVGPVGEVRLGSRGDLLLEVAASRFDELALSAACLFFGLAALVVMLWWRGTRIHAALALYAVSAGVTIFCTSPLRLFLWDSPSGWHYVLWAGRFGTPVGLVIFTGALFGRPLRSLSWFGGALGAAGVLVVALLATRQHLGYDLGWRLLNLEFLASIGVVSALAIGAARKRIPGARPFLLGLAILVVGGFCSSAVARGWLTRDVDFHALGQLGFLLVLGKIAVDRVAFAYRSLQRTEAELTAALRGRDEFISVAAHELRTPIATLNLQVEVLGRQLQSASALTHEQKLLPGLELLRRQIDRLHRLAEMLLDVTRAGERRLELVLEPTDLAGLVQDVVQRHEHDAARAGSALTLDVAGAVQGSWDRLRLDQVITNLLSNALKYGAGRPVRVSLAVVGEEADLQVRDQGIGIPHDRQEAIFGRFERAVSSRNYPGLGLGLWIAREIVLAHGGTLRVESEPGQGSCFILRLPGARAVQVSTG